MEIHTMLKQNQLYTTYTIHQKFRLTICCVCVCACRVGDAACPVAELIVCKSRPDQKMLVVLIHS